jgi:hypothetical protein
MALDAAPNRTVQRPGDFRRRGQDGPPIVPSLTKTRQPKGNKPELQAKARAKGIDPGSMTVDELKAALGPEPADETYGRPSGFGDPLENQFALRKYIERGIAAGVVKLVVDGLDARSIDLEDPGKLDQLVLDAQDAIESMIWADRGTHVHNLIECYETRNGRYAELVPLGEALGLPAPLQHRIVGEWIEFRRSLGVRSIACEMPVIADEYRVAGTLDLLDVFDRALELVVDDTTYEVRAGQPIVGDVKTGDPRDKYAVQIASYVDGVPFDTETEERGEWEPPHPNVGLIYHMPMKAVIDGAPVTWQAIPVDLAVGRDGARICCEARDWPVTPVFGTPIVTHLAAGMGDEAASPPQPAAVDPEVSAPPPGPAANIDDERDELRQRRIRMEANARETGWHGEFLAAWERQGITPESTNAEIKAALDAIEPPFDPDPAPPHGIERPNLNPQVERETLVDAETVDELLELIRSSDSVVVVNAWLGQAHAAGISWDPRLRRTGRLFEITRAAHHLARLTDGDDELARVILAAVIADQSVIQPAFVVGVTLAALTIDEACCVSEMCQRLLELDRSISPADIAALLAAA